MLSQSNGPVPHNMGNPDKPHRSGSRFPPRGGSEGFARSSPPIAPYMLAQERDDLGEHRLVHPHVAGFAKPSAHLGRLGSRRRNDADGHLRSAAVIGTIEGDRADRVTPHTPLGLFLGPIPWLPTPLHGVRSSPRCRGISPPRM